MTNNYLNKNEKVLNRLSSNNQNMKKGVKSSKLSRDKLAISIKEAQKDPRFVREVNKFIKATTRVHKLY